MPPRFFTGFPFKSGLFDVIIVPWIGSIVCTDAYCTQWSEVVKALHQACVVARRQLFNGTSINGSAVHRDIRHKPRLHYGPLQASQAWHRARLGAWPRYAPVYTIGAGHRANSIINMAALNLRHVVRVLIAFLQCRRCHRGMMASLQQLRK